MQAVQMMLTDFEWVISSGQQSAGLDHFPVVRELVIFQVLNRFKMFLLCT